ncbi:hypothetical protein, partial [Kitasatospora purpeofusca]|uniref:hypothetical protein n=2 Tax=Kitasatospora purpeofusca TaxID=67352 RepID=UPI0035DF1F78
TGRGREASLRPMRNGRWGRSMKRFAKTVVGQFTISAIACAVVFGLIFALECWFVSEALDGSPLQK